MTAESFLNQYLDIEIKCFIKKEKNIRLDALLGETLKDNSLATFEEIKYLIQQLFEKEIKIRQALFLKIIYPILSAEVDLNNLEAIKLILRLEFLLIGYQKLTKNHKYSYNELIERGLSLQPDDRELLENYELTLRNYINYSIHEIPIGVIYDNDGASIETCDKLMLTLKKYEDICLKLNLDNSELINEAGFYYRVYKDYLKIYEQYDNFEHYLSELRTTGEQ